jgi:hypothetical protein
MVLEKHRTELVFIIPLVIVGLILVFSPFVLRANSAVSFDAAESYKAQDIRLTANQTAVYDLNLSTDILTSLSISGVVKGTGKASVYLQTTDGAKLLVYSETPTKRPTGITGFSIASDTNYFEDMCADTCYLTNSKGPYSLYIEVDPGTSLKISRVIYK